MSEIILIPSQYVITPVISSVRRLIFPGKATIVSVGILSYMTGISMLCCGLNCTVNKWNALAFLGYLQLLWFPNTTGLSMLGEGFVTVNINEFKIWYEDS